MAELKPFTGSLDGPGLKPFDGQLDGEAPKPSGVIRRLGDAGISLAKGVIGVPEAAVGLGDLVTGGRIGKLAESAGFRPGEAKQILSDYYSPEQKAANQQVQDAQGFLPTVGAMVQNPSTIVNSAVESAPSMLLGGGISRGLMKLAPGMGAVAAGAAGEGAVAAGQNAEQVRQEDPNGTLTPSQAAILAASGALTGGLSFAAGKVANKLGIGDVQTMLAQGKLGAAGEQAVEAGAKKGIVRKAAEGFATEGALQELPQSYQEQVAQNIAQGKPWDEGAAAAGAQGLLTGGLTGGISGPLEGHHDGATAPEAAPTAADQPTGPAPALGFSPLAGTPTIHPDGTVTLNGEQEFQHRTNPQPVKRSEAMGLDPSAGPLSAAAVIAVDSAPALTYDNSPTGTMIAGQDGVRQEGRAEVVNRQQAATEQAQADEEARQRRVELGQSPFTPVTPIDRPAPVAEQARIPMDTAPTGTLVVGQDGVARPEIRAEAISREQNAEEVISNRVRAGKALRDAGPGHELVPVEGGFVVRPVEDVATKEATDGTTGEPGRVAGNTVDAGRADAGPGLADAGRAEPDATGRGENTAGIDVANSPGDMAARADGRPTDALAAVPLGTNKEANLRAGDWVSFPIDKDGNKQIGEIASVRGDKLNVILDSGVRTSIARRTAEYVSKTTGAKTGIDPAVAVPERAPVEAARSALKAPETPVDVAAHEAATSPHNDLQAPTEGQIEAGNYKKGHINVQGLDISVENPAGSTRTGKRPDGSTWSHDMSDHYGYIRRTVGADNEQVDVYVGPQPDSAKVFVVDQLDQKTGGFDEHKALIGFPNQMAAMRAYRSNFDKGWKVGPVKTMSVDEFKGWLKNGDTKKPVNEATAQTTSAPVAMNSVADSMPSKAAAASLGKEVSRDIGQFKQGMSEFRANQRRNELAKANPGVQYTVEEDDKLKNGFAVVGRELSTPVSRDKNGYPKVIYRGEAATVVPKEDGLFGLVDRRGVRMEADPQKRHRFATEDEAIRYAAEHASKDSPSTSVVDSPEQKNAPAAKAATILDAAQVTGKERIEALKDVKAGAITPEELASAYPAKEVTATNKIEDSGEKIGGARKDRWKERGLDLSDLDAMSETEGAEMATKANVWKPDYEAMAEATEPVTAAMVKTVYDQLAAQPKANTPVGRRNYVTMMQAVRKAYSEAKGPEDVKQAGDKVKRAIGLYTDDPAAKKLAREVLFSVYKGRSDPFVMGYTELSKAKKMVEDGFPDKGEPWKKRLALRAYSGAGLTPHGMGITLSESAGLGTPLTKEQLVAGFYRITTKNGNVVGYAPTKVDAEATAKTIYERDLKKTTSEKIEPARPNLDALKRENLPKRIDRDVSADDFVKDFGYRGVEFGNWAAQDERQRIINMAYDGLMDLAEIMGVPPKAMSLDGTLGMAFGSRGGGKAAAHYEPGRLVINMTKINGGGSMAHEWAHALDHYFGELNQKDAYTTKARGASGWYDEQQYKGLPRTRMERDAQGKWAQVTKMRLDNIRPEMAKAFDDVMSALFSGQETKAQMVRSDELVIERYQALADKEIDPEMKAVYLNSIKSRQQALEELRKDPEDKTYPKGRSSYAGEAQKLVGKSATGYWTRPTEMFARAFESWVFDKVAAMGAKSDYLVHGVEEDRFAGGGYKGNPYPTGQERATINAAFDNLASTIQTKETDKGTALYSRSDIPPEAALAAALRTPMSSVESVQAAVRQLVNGIGVLPNSLGRIVVTTSDKIKSDWEPLIGKVDVKSESKGDALGFYSPKTKTVFLIADNIPAGQEMGVAAHELMHKHGETVLGKEGWDKLHGAIEGWAKAKPGSLEREVYEEAAQRVRDSGADLSNQELFPYAVQVALEYGMRPNAMAPQGTVARWLAAVTKAMREAWDKITGKPDLFKTQDLVDLAFGIAQMENPEHAPAVAEAMAPTPERLKALATLARAGSNENLTVDMGKVSPGQAAVLSREGLPVTPGFTHTADVYAVRHAFKKHGDEAAERARGQVPITDAEIARIPEILAAPDAYILGAKSKIGRDLVGYVKVQDDGTALYIEEVRTGKNRLAMTSIRKYPAAKNATEAIRSVLLNVRNDGGDVRIIYPDAKPGQESAPAEGAKPGDSSGDQQYSRSKIIGETKRVYSPELLRAMEHVGFKVEVPTMKERAQAIWKDAGKKLAQGIVDQFAPIKDLDKEAYGLMRLAKGAAGAFETLLKGGQLTLTDGVYDFDGSSKGGVVDRLLKPLGGEHHDFFRWVAANRAERLRGEGKENLFSPEDIAAFKTLAQGQTGFDYTVQNGIRKGQVTRNRAEIYRDSLVTFNGFNKNVLDLAEQSGLIDGGSRHLWEHEFYVPFYRVSEDGGAGGTNIKGSYVRQEAFKALKGGKNALNADLMDNTLMNWAHLLDAAAKNRAAKATIEAAERMGVAMPGTESTLGQMASSIGNKKGVVWFMDGGQKRYSLISDQDAGPRILTAISSLEYAGMKNPVMNAMSAFKHALTLGVTASPFFKVRNLIRDSVQAIGVSELGYNPAANLAQGWKLTDPKSDAYFRLLAGGGTIHFGTMLEGSQGKRIQQLVESGVDAATILKDQNAVNAFYKRYVQPAVHAYNELGDRGEAINRAALYDQLVKRGVSHAEASLQARDLMDFSMQGSFATVRFLTQVVPFMNARIQGLYKLGKSAKEDPAKFASVLGAVAAVSLGLLAAYSDDDDWKKREDWDRNNFWWFKVGGTAFRIPKPFEMGAIATLAERGFELAFDKEMTNKRFLDQVMTLAGDNLSMNPIPQLVKPMLDVYANKDSFSGRPIESLGMDKLKSEYRFNGNTSMTARALSTGMNAVTGLVGQDSLSPVQIDSMLRGYFGWLGSFVVGAADVLARPATDQPEKATPDYWKDATGGIVSDLRNAPSRYVSAMYAQAKELEQAYGTWKSLVKEGKVEEAQAFRQDHQDELSRYRQVEQVKRAEASLNARQRMVERSSVDPDTKRELIRKLQEQKDQRARVLNPA